MKYYNASLYGENDRLMKNNIIEVEDGHVVSVTKGTNPVVTDEDYDCKGKLVYPSFMDSAVVIPGSVIRCRHF